MDSIYSENPTNNWIQIYNSIKSINEKIATLRSDSHIVYTYGVWDLLHPGHIKLLTRARDLGDFLIVGVVADEPIRNLKGPDRPVQKLDERLINVGILRCVDAAIRQPEYDPSRELKMLARVNILTKGDDWDYIPGVETIEELGGKLIKLTYSNEYSTSSIIKKIST